MSLFLRQPVVVASFANIICHHEKETILVGSDMSQSICYERRMSLKINYEGVAEVIYTQ
jgi:hypothetical protein